MKLNDVFLGLLVFFAGVAVYISALSFSPIPGQAYGAETMPKTVSVLTAVLGLFMTIKGVAVSGWRPTVTFDDWTRSPSSLFALGLTIALTIVYIVMAPIAGFVPVVFLMLVVLMVTLGTKPLTAILVSLVAVIVVQQAFGRLLLVPLQRNAWLGFLW